MIPCLRLNLNIVAGIRDEIESARWDVMSLILPVTGSGSPLEGCMSLEQIIIWVVVSGVAGLIAGALVKGFRLGMIGVIIVGIVGAFIGSWLFGLLGIHLGTGILAEIFMAAIGAIVLFLILRALRLYYRGGVAQTII
jgi:uncharacterized membrane protein YeaQ/YmgE (transglycosylase-associated protein family)